MTCTEKRQNSLKMWVRKGTPYHFFCFFYKVYKRPLTPPPFPRFIVTMQIYENTFTTFFLLNMIPWYPKQILLHWEEAENSLLIYASEYFFYANFMLSKPSRIYKIHIINFYKWEWPPPPLYKLYKRTEEMVSGVFPYSVDKFALCRSSDFKISVILLSVMVV